MKTNESVLIQKGSDEYDGLWYSHKLAEAG